MNLDFSVLNFEVPEPEPNKIESRPIYTADAETDPFEHGKMVWPFAWGFYDGDQFKYFWGPNCTLEFMEYVLTLPPGIIYMHNGGKFDIYYLVELILGNRAFIVNRRIVRAIAKLPDGGQHEIRDSYAIMPFPLKDFDKDEIDYQKFRHEVREQYKEEILHYLKKDCTSLHRLCSEFLLRFGSHLTIGSLSMKKLRELHPFECLGPYADADIRRHYYYGGRVECFQRGILSGPWKVYDVNSMFPSVMRDAQHPMERPGLETVKIRKDTCFITAEGKNYGAFPFRTTSDGLRFDIEEGTFHVTRHEWDTALSLDLFKPTRILRCINYRDRGNLSKFVDTYYSLRKQAKDNNDPFGTIFYKYILNSAYGKFAQNPEKYSEWKIDRLNAPEPPRGNGKRKDVAWKEGVISPNAPFPFKIWMRSQDDRSRYNIAVGASITGAARAVLLRAIHCCDTPVYCDTDSLICRNLDGAGIELDNSKLGAWKLEAEADTAMIAGRKLYALQKDGATVKLATKGVKLSAEQIRRVCEGETILYKQDAPTFRLDGSVSFIQRRIKL